MLNRTLGHRAPLLWIVLPMMAGLVLGSATSSGPAAGGALAVLAVFSMGIPQLRVRSCWLLGLVVVIGVGAGYLSYQLHQTRLPVWQSLPPREAYLDLEITRVFPTTDSKRAAGFSVVVGADRHLQDLLGQRVYFSLQVPPATPPPLRSARIATLGVLVAVPIDVPAGSFDAYLAGSGVNFRLNRGRILHELAPPSRYRVFCAEALHRFSTILSRGVDEKRPELTAILRAMLLGQKHELSEDQETLFMQSGTMHLFAISGLHIGVIAVGLQALLMLLRLPGAVRLGLGMGALWLYVDITGGTPSAVRAFIMVLLVELARTFRTPGNPLSALAASALIVLLLWPLQIFSASFQMSYGIVGALLLLGLPLASAWQERWTWFRFLPKPAWRWYHHRLDAGHRHLTSAVALGLASGLVSTLASLRYFQLLTPVSFAANLVLIPASGLVILSGFSSLLSGLVGWDPLSSLFNHGAVLVLAVIAWIVERGVELPGAWTVAQFRAEWVGPVAHLALGATLIFGYHTGWIRRYGGWWPPFAVVGVVLLTGVSCSAGGAAGTE